MTQQFKRGINQVGSTTPIVEKSEGVRPAQHYKPAEYLPLVRFDYKVGDHKVISTGKVLAPDAAGNLVPAGLAIDIRTALAGAQDVDGTATSIKTQLMVIEANTPGTFGNVYTATDVEFGVTNFAGDLAVAGEPVVASMLKSSTINYKTVNGATAWTLATGAGVGKPIGIASYDIWRGNGAGFDNNPADYRYINYNIQQGASILTRYFIEAPVVANTSGVLLKGMAVFEGVPTHGLVTFNKRSNFCMVPDITAADAVTASSVDAYTTEAATDAELKAEFDRVITGIKTTTDALVAKINAVNGETLGRVLFIDSTYPKDYLQYVRTWEPNITGVTGLDKTPGSSTSGLPDNLSLAGVTDPSVATTVRINVLI